MQELYPTNEFAHLHSDLQKVLMMSQLKNRLSRVIKIWKDVHYKLCDSVSGSFGISLENCLGPFQLRVVNRRRKACNDFLPTLLSRDSL